MRTDPDRLTTRLPRYGKASVSDILPSALAVLSDGEAGSDILGLSAGPVGMAKKIVVLMIDGMGHYPTLIAAQEHKLFDDMVSGRTGRFDVLTTNFPSTTPTSLTSLGTGATPGEHGVLGFTVNVPGTDTVLTHIEWDKNPDPFTWQPVTTCFERAEALGISAVKVSPVFEHNGLNDAAFRGSKTVAAHNADELIDGIVSAVSSDRRCLVYGYYSHVDRAGHGYGVASKEWWHAVSEAERIIVDLQRRLGEDCALLVTADHGMINVDEDSRFDITGRPELRQGVRLIAGEPRARYLYTEPHATEEVLARWQEELGHIADVRDRAGAIDAGWFGHVSNDHANRIGDIVVVGTSTNIILGVPEADSATIAMLRGYHGGLTEAEMDIGLWSWTNS